MDNATRNTYVKQQLTTALLTLLTEQPLEQISISTLTATAQVGRVSFYRNFNDKEAILRAHIRQLFAEWTTAYDAEEEPHNDDTLIQALFNHLAEHKDFYQLLERRHLLYLLKEVLFEIVGPKPDYPNAGAYLAAFIAGGLFGWIEEWFARGAQESATEMAAQLAALQTP